MGYLILLVVAAFLGYRVYQTFETESSLSRRDTRKVEMRRADALRAPHSPGAHESLGDALREAGRPADALLSYEVSQSLQTETYAGGAGHLGGSGLPTKIRLTRLDLAGDAERAGKSYAQQVTQRESVCRRCALVNAPDAAHCASCGTDLPTDSFGQTWARDDIRRPLLREAREAFVILAVILFAFYAVGTLPIELQGTILFATIVVLVWKGIRAIGDK